MPISSTKYDMILRNTYYNHKEKTTTKIYACRAMFLERSDEFELDKKPDK